MCFGTPDGAAKEQEHCLTVVPGLAAQDSHKQSPTKPGLLQATGASPSPYAPFRWFSP